MITKGKHTPHFKPGKELRERVDRSRDIGIAINVADSNVLASSDED